MNGPVPLFDPRRGQAPLRAALCAAFARVLDSGRYILGEEVLALEAAVAHHCGVGHAVGVSSGSDALLVALMALGVGPGDEVICPTFTFFASAGAIARLGATPRLVDVCPGCFNLLPDAVADAIGPRTRAIMPVHLFGQLAAMAQIQATADAAGIPVLEDAAQAFGSAADGHAAGAHGRGGCLSFFPTKNLGALGDAGMVVTCDAAFAAACRVRRSHGAEPKYVHGVVGGNFRLDALQAALLREKLPSVAAGIAARQRHAAAYTRALTAQGLAAAAPCLCTSGSNKAWPDAPILLPAVHRGVHTFNQFVIRLNRPGLRDRIRATLTAAGIGTEIYYPVPLHQQACFADLGHAAGDFPHAEGAAAQVLALPIFAELTAAEHARVVAALSAAVATARAA